MKITLRMKLASIAVHADEYLFSGQGHPVDVEAIRGLLQDPEVREELRDLDVAWFLPLRRDGIGYKR